MGKENRRKLNRLVTRVPPGALLPARWLKAQGYSDGLLPKYLESGWLEHAAYGVYRRPGAASDCYDVVEALQHRLKLPVHVGGQTALEDRVGSHYVRMTEERPFTMYGIKRPPGWIARLGLPQRFVWREARALFSFRPDDPHATQAFVSWRPPDRAQALVYSSEERAILELIDEAPRNASVYVAHTAMQGLVGLRPARVSRLLAACRSVKVKRLFLALAHRHNHSWLKYLDLSSVDLGRGKRMLAPSWRLDPRFAITLPADLDAQLG